MKGWWQPPRLRSGDGTEERHATWLELFYDLVFVAAIAQLANNLNRDVSLAGFLHFVILFVPVWWSWIGATFYATRFDTDDLGYRLLTILEIFAVAALAVNAPNGLGKTSAGFALSYATVRVVLVIKYLRAIQYVPVARPLSTRFALAFALAAAIWMVSTFITIPLRFGLWALGLMVDFGIPMSAGRLHAQLPPHISHLSERFGLFTLIVLGESVAAVVNGVAGQQWSVLSAVMAMLGLSIAFSMWWVYFDNPNGSVIRALRAAGQVGIYQTWLYMHLPLAIGLTATGVGVKRIVSSEPGVTMSQAERWLVCGAVALCLLTLEVIHWTTKSSETGLHRKAGIVPRLGATAFVLVLAVAGEDLSSVVLIALVTTACAVQVVLDLLS